MLEIFKTHDSRCSSSQTELLVQKTRIFRYFQLLGRLTFNDPSERTGLLRSQMSSESLVSLIGTMTTGGGDESVFSVLFLTPKSTTWPWFEKKECKEMLREAGDSQC